MNLLAVVAVSTIVSTALFSAFIYGFQRGWFHSGVDRRLHSDMHDDYNNVAYSVDELRLERDQLTEDLEAAHRKIRKLESSETALRMRIDELEQNLLQYRSRASLPTTPLLLICGDNAFGKKDEEQLVRARVRYRTLESATSSIVEAELARRRQNGDLYIWGHIAAHGNDLGIVLADGLKGPEWWQANFEGFQVLFLANCSSVVVGDLLAGLVDAVIVFYGDRESSDIAQFAYLFWGELMRTGKVKDAYDKAYESVPHIRAFVDMRVR